MKLGPYPLEEKVRSYLEGLEDGMGDGGTGVGRELYLDLAEPIVRAAARWQDHDGIIV